MKRSQWRRVDARAATDALLAASGWLALTLSLSSHGFLRAFAVFAFVYSCPGLALVRLVSFRDPLERLVLSVALSIAVSTMLTALLAIAHVLTAASGLAAAAALTTFLVGWRRRPRRPEEMEWDWK